MQQSVSLTLFSAGKRTIEINRLDHASSGLCQNSVMEFYFLMLSSISGLIVCWGQKTVDIANFFFLTGGWSHQILFFEPVAKTIFKSTCNLTPEKNLFVINTETHGEFLYLWISQSSTTEAERKLWYPENLLPSD